ncbi:hypothetical protein FJZ33_06995 [Candidatus Poribacteria bacterium]|nr:hypothetical protein [Candidatus Poribacteria bacterium]
MENFLQSVASSIVASIIIIFATSAVSSKAKWLIIGLLSRLTSAGLYYVYRDKEESKNDLSADISSSNHLKLLVGRGNELQRQPFEALFQNRSKRNKKFVKILLPSTNNINGEPDWIAQREAELAKFDTAYTNVGLLKKQVEGNVSFLQKHSSTGLVEVGRFNAPNFGRLIITDKYLYFTPYSHDSHGRESRVYKYKQGSDIYSNYNRLFDQLWEVRTRYDS